MLPSSLWEVMTGVLKRILIIAGTVMFSKNFIEIIFLEYMCIANYPFRIQTYYHHPDNTEVRSF